MEVGTFDIPRFGILMNVKFQLKIFGIIFGSRVIDQVIEILVDTARNTGQSIQVNVDKIMCEESTGITLCCQTGFQNLVTEEFSIAYSFIILDMYLLEVCKIEWLNIVCLAATIH